VISLPWALLLSLPGWARCAAARRRDALTSGSFGSTASWSSSCRPRAEGPTAVKKAFSDIRFLRQAVLSVYLPGSSQRSSFELCCPRPERVSARSHRVLPSRASVRDRRDCCVCLRCLRLYGLYNLCALFIAIAFETCVVYARIWLLSGAKFKFPFCSLFPIHPPFDCNAPVSSVMRFCSPLGATSACMGGGRGGERALSGEGARRERDPGAGREP